MLESNGLAMALITLSAADLPSASQDFTVRGKQYCSLLESGNIIVFPVSPIEIPRHDVEFLLGAHQTGSGYHKNVAYRPAADRVTGLAKESREVEDRQRSI